MNALRPLAFWRRRAKISALDTIAASGTITADGLSRAREMPRPAIKWLGNGARIALRSFDFAHDADAVCAFQEETYRVNFPDFEFTPEFAQAFRHDLRRAALDTSHEMFVLDEGAPVGFLWLVICENNWTLERYGYINNIFINPRLRGQGLAAELMAQAEAFFRNRRIRRVRLTVTASNVEAVHLYERSGYQVTRWEMEKEL